jgi:hypothetical protein
MGVTPSVFENVSRLVSHRISGPRDASASCWRASCGSSSCGLMLVDDSAAAPLLPEELRCLVEIDPHFWPAEWVMDDVDVVVAMAVDDDEETADAEAEGSDEEDDDAGASNVCSISASARSLRSWHSLRRRSIMLEGWTAWNNKMVTRGSRGPIGFFFLFLPVSNFQTVKKSVLLENNIS